VAACVVPVVQPSTGVTYLTVEVRADISTCPYTLDDSSSAWHELSNMSIPNAQEIAIYVGVVWAIAWGFKTLARILRTEVPEVS